MCFKEIPHYTNIRMDKRQIMNYTLDEQWKINTLSTIVKLELELMERDATLYHNEQLISAHQIITHFQNLHVVNQMVLGKNAIWQNRFNVSHHQVIHAQQLDTN